MNMNEPDELSIFRGWFLSFMKPLQFITIEKSKDEFENFYNHLVQIKLFVKPGLESMNFSWTKNSVISRLFSAFIKAFFQSNSTNFI